MSKKYPGTLGWPERLWRIWDNAENDKLRAFRTTPDAASQFGETLVVERTPIIELNSSYGTSKLRDIETTSGTGAISPSEGSLKVSTGTTSGSTSILDSAETGRYVPGYGAQLGVGLRIPAIPTGDAYIEWGGVSQNEDNALGFGVDADGIYIYVLRDGVEEVKVRQSDWNLDPLDGTGTSGYTLDTSDGTIYEIDFTWYGYGQILFNIVGVVVDANGDRKQTIIACHSYVPTSATSVVSPNLRLRVKVDNGTTTGDLSAFVGGRQYSIIGKYIPKFRFTHEYRDSVSTSTTFEPLVSYRRKSNFGDRSIKLQSYTVLATTEPHIIEMRLDATLTGSSFGTPTGHDSSETALESDTSATAVTGGMVVWQDIVDGSGNRNTSVLSDQLVDFDIPNGSILTMCARTLSGTGSIVSGLRVREEW